MFKQLAIIALTLAANGWASTAKPIYLGFTEGLTPQAPQYSNDGKYAAFADRRLPDNGNYFALYLIDLTRPHILHEVAIASRAAGLGGLRFSMDSKYLVYVVLGPDSRIMSLSIPNLEMIRLTPPGIGFLTRSPRFSESLIYSGDVGDRRELFRVNLDGTDATSLTPGHNVTYYYSRENRDWVLYVTPGRILRVSKDGGNSAEVFSDRDGGRMFFSTSGDHEHLYFLYVGGNRGCCRAYRNFYSLTIDGENFQQLGTTIDAYIFGWDRSQKATFIAIGDIRGATYSDPHQAQVRIHNVHADADTIIDMPAGYAAGSYFGLMNFSGEEKIVIGVGPSVEEFAHPDGIEAVWAVSHEGHFEELIPANGDRGSILLIGIERNKALRVVQSRFGGESGKDYINLIDLQSGSERHIADGRFNVCEAESEGLVYLLRYDSPELGGRTLLVIDGNNGRQFEMDLGPEAEAQFSGNCENPHNGRLITYYEKFNFDKRLYGYKSYLLEVPLFSGSFELEQLD